MKVKNPDYVPQETVGQAEMAEKEGSLRIWFAANKNIESVTFGEIREKYSKTAEQWPDGLIHQKLSEWGLEVIGD